MECASSRRFSIAAPQSCCQNSDRSSLPQTRIDAYAWAFIPMLPDTPARRALVSGSATTTKPHGLEFLALGAFMADSSMRTMSSLGIFPSVYFLMLLRPSMASLQSMEDAWPPR